LFDADCEGLAATLSLPVTDDLDQILLLLVRQFLNHFKHLLKRRDG
jgi:hypothetical protein